MSSLGRSGISSGVLVLSLGVSTCECPLLCIRGGVASNVYQGLGLVFRVLANVIILSSKA